MSSNSKQSKLCLSMTRVKKKRGDFETKDPIKDKNMDEEKADEKADMESATTTSFSLDDRDGRPLYMDYMSDDDDDADVEKRVRFEEDLNWPDWYEVKSYPHPERKGKYTYKYGTRRQRQKRKREKKERELSESLIQESTKESNNDTYIDPGKYRMGSCLLKFCEIETEQVVLSEYGWCHYCNKKNA